MIAHVVLHLSPAEALTLTEHGLAAFRFASRSSVSRPSR
jgi:hypothetical protein